MTINSQKARIDQGVVFFHTVLLKIVVKTSQHRLRTIFAKSAIFSTLSKIFNKPIFIIKLNYSLLNSILLHFISLVKPYKRIRNDFDRGKMFTILHMVNRLWISKAMCSRVQLLSVAVSKSLAPKKSVLMSLLGPFIEPTTKETKRIIFKIIMMKNK